MAKPEERGCAVGLWSLGVALAAVAGLAVGVVWLDARRQDQLTQLGDRLDTLRQLVDTMQKQLDRHEERINSTLHTKSPVRSEPPEEVVYEDEYDYDDEDGSYEYDEEEEPTPKATVKRTTILSDSTPSRDSTEPPVSETTPPPTRARTRRDTRSQEVTVREERYVPSTPYLKAILDYKNKSEGLRIYATYFGTEQTYVGSSEKNHHLKYRKNKHTGSNNEPEHEMKSLSQTAQQNPQQLRTSVYQEQRRPAESTVRLRHGGRNGHVRMDEVELVSQNSPEDLEPEKPTENKVNLLAAHFIGDVSNYNTRDHVHYYGNNILYHPQGMFKDWVPSNWMFELGTYTDFPLYNGKLSIQKPGIYFVYAQVYYAAAHDRCGFHIKLNGDEVAQCASMTTGRVVKRNTCFTAVILHLHKSDALWISEVEGHRNTSFKSSHSFFGLIQLKPT